jgi:hypothetical protein
LLKPAPENADPVESLLGLIMLLLVLCLLLAHTLELDELDLPRTLKLVAVRSWVVLELTNVFIGEGKILSLPA